MKQLLLFVVVLLSFEANAQFDTGNKSLTIPPSDNSTSTPSSALSLPKKDPFYVPPSITGAPSGNSPGIDTSPTNPFPGSKPHFMNPGQAVQDKLNTHGDGQLYKVLRQNQYLGDFRTKSTHAKVIYRDYGTVDGDMIRVWVNDKVYKEQLYLEGDFQGFDLVLQPGFNKIDFEALNQGSLGPNTAEFQVLDDDGKVISSNNWDLATGFKATIILVKE
jgi:hypothetical protein